MFRPSPKSARPVSDEHRHEPANYEIPERTAPTTLYGPRGESRVFQPDDEVPDGWFDHPRLVADFVDPLAEPEPLDL